MYTEQITQSLAIADVVNFTAANNTNLNSSGIDLSKYRRVWYVIGNGGLGAAGTIDGRLQSSANSNFNVVHNIANSNLTQITTNLVTATIEVRADQVENANHGDRYVRLQLTTGGNALTGVWAVGYGGEAAQKPANQGNLNSNFVSQQVVVS